MTRQFPESSKHLKTQNELYLQVSPVKGALLHFPGAKCFDVPEAGTLAGRKQQLSERRVLQRNWKLLCTHVRVIRLPGVDIPRKAQL